MTNTAAILNILSILALALDIELRCSKSMVKILTANSNTYGTTGRGPAHRAGNILYRLGMYTRTRISANDCEFEVTSYGKAFRDRYLGRTGQVDVASTVIPPHLIALISSNSPAMAVI